MFLSLGIWSNFCCSLEGEEKPGCDGGREGGRGNPSWMAWPGEGSRGCPFSQLFLPQRISAHGPFFAWRCLVCGPWTSSTSLSGELRNAESPSHPLPCRSSESQGVGDLVEGASSGCDARYSLRASVLIEEFRPLSSLTMALHPHFIIIDFFKNGPVRESSV